jgi:hypothetical protein
MKLAILFAILLVVVIALFLQSRGVEGFDTAWYDFSIDGTLWYRSKIGIWVIIGIIAIGLWWYYSQL